MLTEVRWRSQSSPETGRIYKKLLNNTPGEFIYN